MSDQEIHIIGAGPSGLAAALYLGRAGLKPIVFEQAHEVGRRFQGDFQGLENWSTEDDATEMLAGFGLRYAIRSGMLAGRAIAMDEDYDVLVEEHLAGRLKASLANRVLFDRLGNHGYSWALRRLSSVDVGEVLRRHHRPSAAKNVLYDIGRRRYSARQEPSCNRVGCTCLWCEHDQEEGTASSHAEGTETAPCVL